MRVASWVVFSSIFFAAASAGAASVVEASVAYPTAVSARNAVAAQDAIKPSAAQQRRDSSAHSSKTSGANFAASARTNALARANALAFDRRLASLDPSQIVYEQSQSQPLAQVGLLDLGNGRLFPRPEQRLPQQRPQARSAGDFLLMGFAALMLIAYQLRKKHRILRPHPFSY